MCLDLIAVAIYRTIRPAIITDLHGVLVTRPKMPIGSYIAEDADGEYYEQLGPNKDPLDKKLYFWLREVSGSTTGNVKLTRDWWRGLYTNKADREAYLANPNKKPEEYERTEFQPGYHDKAFFVAGLKLVS